MADQPGPSARGRSKRGGLGKYLRARGRRGGGRPAEFGKRLVLEGEREEEGGSEDSEDDSDAGKYAKRQLGTNADRYEEPEVDPNVEQEPEPEVDLSSFLARQRLDTEDDNVSHHDDDDDIDKSLAHLPSSSSNPSNTRKNKAQRIEWDASMDQLKREKEAAEAVWDLKSRFRKNQPRLATTHSAPSRRQQRAPAKVEDARHIPKPPDADDGNPDSEAPPANKTDMEDFLDDLLS